jgi:hypothetical protein
MWDLLQAKILFASSHCNVFGAELQPLNEYSHDMG